MTEQLLDFEGPVASFNESLSKLPNTEDNAAAIAGLQKEKKALLKKIYADLTPWQTCMVARHPARPYMMDYVNALFTDFEELHGDRHFADDASIVGGLARFGKTSLMLIGQQKGRDTKERMRRNFGMTKPEGYRKAQRLMKLAEKFNLPVVTFIDTPGAFPGIDAEERGQSEAIGYSLYTMAGLRVPVISFVIGEGGSGGALALGVSDKIYMLQYAVYSVISPEGCSAILFKDQTLVGKAADALCITADRLLELGLIDAVVPEPLGGAHRDYAGAAAAVKKVLTQALKSFKGEDWNSLPDQRQKKWRNFGKYAELALRPEKKTESSVTGRQAEQPGDGEIK